MRITASTAVAATTSASTSSSLGKRILDHVKHSGQLQGTIEFRNSVAGVAHLSKEIAGFRDAFRRAGITISAPTLVQDVTRGVFARFDFEVAPQTPPGARAVADQLGITTAGQLRRIARPIVEQKAVRLAESITTLATRNHAASGRMPWGSASSSTSFHIDNTLAFVNRQLAPIFAEAGIRLRGDGMLQAGDTSTAYLTYTILRPSTDGLAAGGR